VKYFTNTFQKQELIQTWKLHAMLKP